MLKLEQLSIFTISNTKEKTYLVKFLKQWKPNQHLHTTIDRLRNNEDKLQNTYGKLLIELCKIKTLFIVNWRIGDNLTGKITSQNSSEVDYFLCDCSIYKYVSDRLVFDQSSLFSDVHTPIVMY